PVCCWPGPGCSPGPLAMSCRATHSPRRPRPGTASRGTATTGSPRGSATETWSWRRSIPPAASPPTAPTRSPPATRTSSCPTRTAAHRPSSAISPRARPLPYAGTSSAPTGPAGWSTPTTSWTTPACARSPPARTARCSTGCRGPDRPRRASAGASPHRARHQPDRALHPGAGHLADHRAKDAGRHSDRLPADLETTGAVPLRFDGDAMRGGARVVGDAGGQRGEVEGGQEEARVGLALVGEAEEGVAG